MRPAKAGVEAAAHVFTRTAGTPRHTRDGATHPDRMYGRERRRQQHDDPAALRAGLTPAQLHALETLEQFRWTLKFVRRPMFQDPVPVVVDRDGKRHAVLRADGSLDESPGFRIRD